MVPILDIRAVKGGKYYEDMLLALPPCRIAEALRGGRILSAAGKVWSIICNRKNALLGLGACAYFMDVFKGKV